MSGGRAGSSARRRWALFVLLFAVCATAAIAFFWLRGFSGDYRTREGLKITIDAMFSPAYFTYKDSDGKIILFNRNIGDKSVVVGHEPGKEADKSNPWRAVVDEKRHAIDFYFEGNFLYTAVKD